MSHDLVKDLDEEALIRSLFPFGGGGLGDIKTVFSLDRPLSQDYEELHCPDLPVVSDWPAGHRPPKRLHWVADVQRCRGTPRQTGGVLEQSGRQEGDGRRGR